MARKISREMCLKVCKEYQQGASSYDIARKYKIGHSTALRILYRFGVAARALTEAKREYAVNNSYFSAIDTEGKAYCLGYFVAEGHLAPQIPGYSARLHVGVSFQEREHLQKIASLFGNYIVRVRQIKKSPPQYLAYQLEPTCQ